MPFMLVAHGSRHVEVQSAAGHRIRFAVCPKGDPMMVLDEAMWKAGRCPPDEAEVLDGASRFARRCAEAFELV